MLRTENRDTHSIPAVIAKGLIKKRKCSARSSYTYTAEGKAGELPGSVNCKRRDDLT